MNKIHHKEIEGFDPRWTDLEKFLAAATMVQDHFVGKCFKWEIAGSVRRKMPKPGDIEHVVIQKSGEVKNDATMFPIPVESLVNHELELMIETGQILKAKYENGRTRWGAKSRAFTMTKIEELQHVRHEIYTATVDTWGVVMALRTGPAKLSKHLVTVIKRRGYEVRDGNQVFPLGRDTPLPMKTEEEFFDICGVKFEQPQARRGIE